MPDPRQNSVYDLTSLRLHPDGTRNSRGGWIANDAGGTGRVTRYRTLKRKGKERADDTDAGGEVEAGEGETATARERDDEEYQPSEEEGKVLKDYRAIKRRKFEHDFDFISPSPVHQYASTSSDMNGIDDSSLSLPSSDLLKCIHFMACQYYHERGQLLNASKEFRKQRKLRRLAKLRQASNTASQQEEEVDGHPSDSDQEREDSDPESDEDGDYPANESDEDDEEDQEEEKEEDEDEEDEGNDKKKRRKVDRNPVIDMYRTMNGSALMALGASLFITHYFHVPTQITALSGMLVQEHIAEVLRPRIPDDWEDGVQEFESDNEADTDGEDEESSATKEPEALLSSAEDEGFVEEALQDSREGSPAGHSVTRKEGFDQSSSSDES
ncbi:hypothetical protein V5O48_002070 [Marasmius crinis-equi]|uniref:Uncharacterized protein n=1 Tax=Marasmius crinis-equi TaxID=585013 RepID=A0ABR3FWJ5_9AGAR